MKEQRLQQATSPYLQQHADNPVDWYPWGKEALEKARKENKPILLSIGYFACHWCHVMARESFADPKTAEIMNAHFINIKIDREERPDLDQIYQLSHQLLTGRGGGWPLTVFLTPHDLIPFFAGTYFPPESRYGIPGFKDVLIKIADYFDQHPTEITQHGKYLKAAFAKMELTSTEKIILNSMPLSRALQEIANSFDNVNGGFGDAPKFPHPTILEYLIYTRDRIDMAHFSLLKIAKGGIYDQLGGGFFRYCVDANWQIPHFEKMLYDNAQLLSCYSQAGLIKHESHFARVVEETSRWLLDEMQASEGGFYSALDADSEHCEGKYYYWDKEEIKNILTHEEYKSFSTYYNLDHPPNFEHHWHLAISRDEAPDILIASARKKLLMARKKRVLPGCDQKILTSWNALLIKGFAHAGRYLQRDGLIFEAQKIVDFIRNTLWDGKQLYACYRNHHAYQAAYLDDYAFLIDALYNLLQQNWRTDDLNFAIDLTEVLLANFYDEKTGGFFFTPQNSETLIYRNKPIMDNVIPSGNGIASRVLVRLGYLLGETRYLEVAEKTLKFAWPSLEKHPSLHCTLLNTLDEYLNPPEIIIYRGEGNSLKSAHKGYFKKFNPRTSVFAIPNSEKNLPAALKSKSGKENKVVSYICSGMQCNEKVILTNGL